LGPRRPPRRVCSVSATQAPARPDAKVARRHREQLRDLEDELAQLEEDAREPAVKEDGDAV